MANQATDTKATATTTEAAPADNEIVRTYQNADGTVAVDATEAEFEENLKEQGYRLVVDATVDPQVAQAEAEKTAAEYAEKSQGEPAPGVPSQASATATKSAEKPTNGS